MAEPLRKMHENGSLYKRPPGIEELVDSLMDVPDEKLFPRVKINNKNDSEYIPSECLVYLLRKTRNDGDTERVEVLFTELRERIIRSTGLHGMTTAGARKNGTLSFDVDWLDAILERFNELLCSDRRGYEKRLDYYECRFNSALLALRIDMQRKVAGDQKHYKLGLEDDEAEITCNNTSESLAKWKEQISNPSLDFLYRSKLAGAINSLPPNERRAIELIFFADSNGTEDDTLAYHGKILNCGKQTVRNRRNRAIARLRAALEEGEDSE